MASLEDEVRGHLGIAGPEDDDQGHVRQQTCYLPRLVHRLVRPRAPVTHAGDVEPLPRLCKCDEGDEAEDESAHATVCEGLLNLGTLGRSWVLT